jgi:hypothetical protein
MVSVPVSKDEDADTEIVRTWGTPKKSEDLLHHHDLLWCAGCGLIVRVCDA